MKNILNKININSYTYLFLLLVLLCGFIKNILIIFFICIVHELGHIFFIKLFKYKIINVTIYPFGGITKIDKMINSSINKDLIITCGGVLFQIILGIILFFYQNKINPINYNLFTSYNQILLIFNLLPLIPLDGSKLTNLLFQKFYSYKLSYYLCFYVSILALIIFIYLNYAYNYDNYFIVGFLIYELIIYVKNYKYLFNRFLLERYLYDCEYHKIINNTKEIKDLKNDTYHYFKSGDRVISEKEKLKRLFDKSSYF